MLKAFRQLLDRIKSDTPPSDEELAQAFTDLLADASVEELTELKGELVADLKAAASGDTPDLTSAAALREGVDQVDARITEINTEKARVAAEAAKLLEGLDPDGDDTDDPDTEEPDAATVTPAEDKELIAVGAGFGAGLKKTRSNVTKDVEEPTTQVRVTTLGVATGKKLGNANSMNEIGKLFADTARNVKNPGDKQALVGFSYEFPDDRILSKDQSKSDQILDAFFGLEALAAAGGICAPVAADFSHPILGERSRPIRDALGRFRADTGGVRYSPAADLTAVTGAVSVWTHETDSSPGENVKPCPPLECADELAAYVDAVTACLEIGNFAARFSPSFWTSRLALLGVMHDRIAEDNLYSQIEAVSTAVTYTETNGRVSSVLNGIDQLVAGIQSRHRIRNTQIMAIIPDWLPNFLRQQVAFQRYAGNTGDQYALARATIQSWLTTRGVTPVFTQDSQIFAAQGAGAVTAFPDSGVPEILVFPADAFFFLDGGTLDLGTEIKDSVLNSQNNRQAFWETFEGIAWRGIQSYALTFPGLADLVCECPAEVIIEAEG